MSYKIEMQSIQKLIELNNLLNQLEIKGATNVSILFACLNNIQQVIQELEKNNKTNENGINIDNTKKEE
jgi:hypothetical protein